MSDQTPTTEETTSSRFLAGVNKALPLVQWLVIGAIGVGTLYIAQRDTQTNQSFAIQKLETGQQQLKDEIRNKGEARDRQLETLKKEVLTREVFDAYHKGDSERMQRIENMVERILEHQNR